MRKKLIGLLLGAALTATAITGCGGSKTPETQATEAKTEAATKAETEAATQAAEAETEAAVAEALTEVQEAVEELVSEGQEVVEEAVTEAQEAVEEAVSEAQEAVAEPVSEAVEEIGETMSEAVEEAGETMSEAVEEAGETMSEAQEAVEEAVTEAQEAVEEAVSEAQEAVEEPVSEALEAAGELMTEAQEAVEETVSEAQEVVEEAVTEAQEAVEEALTEAQEAIEETVTEAQEVVEEVVSEAQEAVEEPVSEALEAAGELMTEAEEVIEETLTEAEEVIEETLTEAEEAIEEFVSEAQEAVEEPVSEALEAAEELITEAEEAVEETLTEAQEAIEEIMTELEEIVAEEETEEVSEEPAAAEAVEEETEAAEVVEEETEAAEVVEEETEAAEVVEEETEAAEVVEELTEAVTEEGSATVFGAATAAGEEEEEAIEYTVAIDPNSGARGTLADMTVEEGDIVVLYDNDVHGGISADSDYSGSDKSLGYAGLAAVKAEVAETASAVTTVDNGDAIFGSIICSESKGRDAVDLMKAVGYDILIPGNHEFDFGMDAFLNFVDEWAADGIPYISANFKDLRTDELVLDPYVIVPYTVGDKEIKIGYVGLSTPETIAKSTPTYFQDEDGNFIYSFCADTDEFLYETIQASVDAAIEDGADMIIALSHMGDTGVEAGWSIIDVALNTTGIDIILDGHAHSVIESDLISNADGEDVLLTSTGTKLENIGVLTLTLGEDNVITASAGLVSELTEEETASDAYVEMREKVDEIQAQYDYLFEVEGTTDYDLVIYDPENPDIRLVRNANTNMADFLTDAYRTVTGADIAFLNGGSIRANLNAGDIQYIGLRNVFPWGTLMSVIEVTGQQILDSLEMGAREYPEECGGFIVPSGLTYAIDATIPDSVNVNSDGEFVSVDGEYRVKNVMVGDEPLDLEKTYTLAINDYYSIDCGDGMTMFKGSKVVDPADGSDHYLDISIIIEYLAGLENNEVGEEYSNPYGQGRITFITEVAEEETEAVEEETEAVAEETEALEEAAEEAVTEAGTESVN